MIDDSASIQIDQLLTNESVANKVSSTGWLGNRLCT